MLLCELAGFIIPRHGPGEGGERERERGWGKGRMREGSNRGGIGIRGREVGEVVGGKKGEGDGIYRDGRWVGGRVLGVGYEGDEQRVEKGR